MQTLYKRGAEAKDFVRSLLAGNEQPDTQGRQAVAVNMKAMRAAAESELFRNGCKERGGHWRTLGLLGTEVRSDGLKLAVEFRWGESERGLLAAETATVEIENHPARPWSECEFRQHMRERIEKELKRRDGAWRRACKKNEEEKLVKRNLDDLWAITGGEAVPAKESEEKWQSS